MYTYMNCSILSRLSTTRSRLQVRFQLLVSLSCYLLFARRLDQDQDQDDDSVDMYAYIDSLPTYLPTYLPGVFFFFFLSFIKQIDRAA